jgi:hypothetical protein
MQLKGSPFTRMGVIELTTLLQHALNRRVQCQSDVEKAKEELDVLGQRVIIIDENNLVVWGYAHVLAAQERNLNPIMTITYHPPLTNEEKRNLLIEDGHSLVADMIGSNQAAAAFRRGSRRRQ